MTDIFLPAYPGFAVIEASVDHKGRITAAGCIPVVAWQVTDLGSDDGTFLTIPLAANDLGGSYENEHRAHICLLGDETTLEDPPCPMARLLIGEQSTVWRYTNSH